MKTDENKSLIGTQVYTTDGDLITIKDMKTVGEEDVYSDDEGNLYTDDQLEWNYRLSPGRILYDVLTGYDAVDVHGWDSEQFPKMADEFMKEMVRCGYVENNKQ